MFPNWVYSSPATFLQEKELLEVAGHVLSSFQRVWVLVDSAWPAVPVLRDCSVPSSLMQWRLVSEGSILPCALLPPSLGLTPRGQRPIGIYWKIWKKPFPRAVSRSSNLHGND